MSEAVAPVENPPRFCIECGSDLREYRHQPRPTFDPFTGAPIEQREFVALRCWMTTLHQTWVLSDDGKHWVKP